MGSRRNNESLWGTVFVFPTVTLLLVFTVIPAVNAFYYSLTRYDFLSPPKFTGFSNYLHALTDPVFYQVMGNTFFLAIGVPAGIILALILAVVLSDRHLRHAALYRSIYFLPVILPLVAVGTVWKWLFNMDYGPVNQGLAFLHMQPIPWLVSYEWSKITVMTVGVWSGFGGSLVILMGGIASIPESCFEAGKIDGAGGFRMLWSITLPMMLPTIVLVSIISFIGALQVFDLVLVLTGGGPGLSSTPIVQYIYQKAFSSFRLGYASSLAILLFLLMIVLSIFQFRMGERKRDW